MDDKAQQEIPNSSNLPALASGRGDSTDASNKLVNPGSLHYQQQVEDTPSPFLASLAKTVGEVTEAITQTAAQTGKAFVESAAEVGRQLKQTHQLSKQLKSRAGSHSHQQ